MGTGRVMLIATCLWHGLLTKPAESADQFLTGAEFQQAIEAPLTASRPTAPFKEIVQRLTAQRQVCLIIDRRIDPTSPITVDLQSPSLRVAIEELSGQIDSKLSLLSATVYIAPPPAARRLNTLVAIKLQELTRCNASANKKRKLQRPLQLDWDPVTEPRELLGKIAAACELAIENPESLPHDIWDSGTIMAADAAEALQLVLNQFDMTFEWSAGGSGIKLVSLPKTIAVEREHLVPREMREGIEARLANTFPECQVQLIGGKLDVRGTVEEHAAIAQILRGEEPQKATTIKMVPLAQRRYSPRVVRQPALNLIEQLQRTGNEIRFDSNQLAEREIDLQTLISLDLSKATAEEMFTAICQQVDNLTFRVDGDAIELLPIR